VRQLPDGRYVVQVEGGYTPAGGRRRPKKIAATLEDAKQIRKQMLRAAGAGTLTVRSVTVKAWADTWLPRQAARLRPGTFKSYRARVTRYIVPTIGRYQLDKLNPGHVRTVTTAVRDAGHGSTTARGVQVILDKMLKDAIRDGHTVPAAVLATEKPRKAINDRGDVDLDAALRLIEEAGKRPESSRWLAALYMGLRQEERLGLEWDRVDLDGGQIDVSWQLANLPYNEPRRPSSGFRIPDGYEHRILWKSYALVRPKTEAGKRPVPLARPVVEQMAKLPHRAGLVWARTDGRPISVHDDNAEWRALQDAAGVRHPSGRYYYGHELRHTTGTLLLALGVDEQIRMRIMGHSSVAASRGYAHTNLDMARAAIAAVGERLAIG
jgi:integrase